MQTRKILAGLTALALAASSTLAFADPDDHGRGRGNDQRGNAYGHDRDRRDDRRVERRDGPDADHSTFAPESLTTLAHFAISVR